MPMPKLSEVSSRYGAPMGRRNIYELDQSTEHKFYLQYVPFVDACYDRGGAYWGSPANLWRAYCEEEDEHGVLVAELFIRASSREQAKAAIREEYPYATFYR